MKGDDHEGIPDLWEEFDTTPLCTEGPVEGQDFAESLAFKLATMQRLDEAFAGNNDHQVYLERSMRIVEQLGLVVDDQTDPELLKKAHQAYYLAFSFADVDFIDGSSEVEGVFNQRGLSTYEFKQAATQARERLEADPMWAQKLSTALPLFTETFLERQVACAVFSVAIMQIAYWEIDQSSIGEVKRLTAWHLRQRFDALMDETADNDATYADTIACLEREMRIDKKH